MVGPALPHIIRLAILDVDIPVPAVSARFGTYSNIFADVLHKAASRINEKELYAQRIEIQTAHYNWLKDECPPDLSQIDGILITGSASSAYDDEVWIRRLEAYVRDVYINHPRIKIFGSCFGHQLLCQALLGEYRVAVRRNPTGYELGVQQVDVNADFLTQMPVPIQNLPSYTSKLSRRCANGTPQIALKVQFVHADEVTGPMPSSWVVLGTSAQCVVQGVLEPGRILTLQGHFEFDRFVNRETIRHFGGSWDPEYLAAGLKMVEHDDDAELLAEMVACFYAS